MVTGYFHFQDEEIDYAVYMKNGKYGLIGDGKFLTDAIAFNIDLMGRNKIVLNKSDSTSEIIFQGKSIQVAQYTQEISEFFGGRFGLLYGGSQGVVVMNFVNGETIEEGQYDYKIFEQGFIEVISDKSWKVIDTSGVEIVPWRTIKHVKNETLIKISGSDFYSPNAVMLKDTALLIFSNDVIDLVSFYGDTLICDYNGGYPRKKVNDPKRHTNHFYHWTNGGVYFTNEKGDTSRIFKSYHPNRNSYPYVVVNPHEGREGLFNIESMQFELYPKYYHLNIDQDNVLVSTNKAKGVYSINKHKFYLDSIYTDIKIDGDQIFAYKENNLFVYRDTSLMYSKENVKKINDHWRFHKIEFTDGKVGLYTVSGEPIIPPKYDEIAVFYSFSANTYFAALDGKEWSIIDERAREISKLIFTSIECRRWFNILETGNYFREIYYLDDFGRIYETEFTRHIPNP